MESQLPRQGVNPLTNDASMPLDSAVLNAINGKERAAFDDLQYSCICPLPQTRSCPPPRILRVLQGVGNQAVVASICPKNMTDRAARDFGYRPVIGTFVKQAARLLIT